MAAINNLKITINVVNYLEWFQIQALKHTPLNAGIYKCFFVDNCIVFFWNKLKDLLGLTGYFLTNHYSLVATHPYFKAHQASSKSWAIFLSIFCNAGSLKSKKLIFWIKLFLPNTSINNLWIKIKQLCLLFYLSGYLMLFYVNLNCYQ